MFISHHSLHRYDKLVKEFLPPNASLQCSVTGVTISVDRIQALILTNDPKSKEHETQVFICSIGRGALLEDRIQIATELWSHGIQCEYLHSDRLSLEELSMQCSAAGIEWMVILKVINARRGRDINRRGYTVIVAW